jgi:hypothetical protein
MIEPDTFYEMLENIQHGVDIKLAMKAFGVSKNDLERWHKVECIKAKAQATIAMQKIINEHGAEDWRAMQWIIERNNRAKENGQNIEIAINKQIAKELAKGLIESSITGTIGTNQSSEGVSGSEQEDYSDSQESKGVLQLPENKINKSTDGNF